MCLLGLGLLWLVAAAPGARAAGCPTPSPDCALRDLAAFAGIDIGTAVTPALLASDPTYAAIVAREFSSLTPENELKWYAVHPQPDVYNFAPVDAVVDFATAHGQQVRGHTLVWDQTAYPFATPAWVGAATTPDAMRAVMTEHFETVMGRYQGRIGGYDVVNEPLIPGTGTIHPNVFTKALGPGYIAEAFRIAHAADPGAKLFLNEVYAESLDVTFDAVHDLLAGFIADGVPVGGVGLQSHFLFPDALLDPVKLRQRIHAFGALGLTVELTELDIPLRPNLPRDEALARQRQDYFDVVSACVSEPACKRITLWGFTDRHTWLDSVLSPQADPLIFDESYASKPSYDGVRDALLAAAVPEPSTALLLGPALAALSAWRRARSRR